VFAERSAFAHENDNGGNGTESYEPLGLRLASTPRKIVTLPRTSARKPYIPSQSNESSPLLTFNVSHQYPLIGLAYMYTVGPNQTIGLDIVKFNEYKRTIQLYSSIDDFIHIFRDSFSSWEWTRIMNHRDFDQRERVREFFLRWSIKEAYTKALGSGMTTEFSSFETHLIGIDNHDVCDSGGSGGGGIWDHMSENHKNDQTHLHVRGKVCHVGKSTHEIWEFIFLPLGNDDETNDDGCGQCSACICLGSTIGLQQAISVDINVSHMSIRDLVNYHVGSKN